MTYRGGLSVKEAKEWQSLKAKGKRHKISVERVGVANVKVRGYGHQLGTGNASVQMDAIIKVQKKRAKK